MKPSLVPVLTLAALAASSACISDRVLRRDDDGALVADDVVVSAAKHQTELSRGLPFRRDVPLELMSVEELEAWLNRYYDRAKRGLQIRDRFMHKLGILPPTRDTASTWKGFIGGFAGGIYDNDRVGADGEPGTMLLITDYAWWSKVQMDIFGVITGVDYAYEVFLVHELTHALQDQHLELDRLLEGAVDDDVRMVQKTLLESEANVIGMAHFAGIDLDAFLPRTAFFLFTRYNNALNGPMMLAAAGKTPSFFSQQAFSQYELGLGFVEDRLNAGDWRRFTEEAHGGPMAELARAYARVPGTPGAMPESTEQLLFPWKMSLLPDHPLRVAPLAADEIVDTAADDADDDDDGQRRRWRWRGHDIVDSGVFGALAFRHWLESAISIGAFSIADGWGGDRYEVLVDDDDQTVIVWRILSDSDGDAAEYMAAIRDRVRSAHGGGERVVASVDDDDVYRAVVAAAPDEKRAVRTTRAEHLYVGRRGRAVVVVMGLDEHDDLDATVEALFAVAVASEPSPADDARRAAVAASLEKTLDQTIETVSTRASPSLHEALVSPARRMQIRLGGRFSAVDVDDIRALPFGELRWGVRPWLELSLPFGATIHTTRGPFQFALTAAPRLLPLFSPHLDPFSGRAIAAVSAVEGDVGAVVQLDADVKASFADADVFERQARARGAVVLRPLPWLLLMPGVEFKERDPLVDPGPQDSGALGIRVGGVVARGLVDAPLVEIELLRGLRLIANGVVEFAPTERQNVLRYEAVGVDVDVGFLFTL